MLTGGTNGGGALLPVYRRVGPVFVGGEGSELIAEDGRRFVDFTSGIAVTSLGHGSPVVRAALLEALDTGLIHTSNLFRTGPGERLAAVLAERSGLDRVFFCNSGAEGVEAALKFARRWALDARGRAGGEFVALRGSFHGRLFGSLATTDRPAYQDPFRPLMPGVVHVEADDDEEIAQALDPERVAALIVEPLQGEGGVRVIHPYRLRWMREVTRERGILLIADEVQCGLGRTGRAFAYQESDILPDIVVLAKPLAGGLPMGAVLLSEEVASSIRPGDHATTFGGGPLVASVALAVVTRLTDPDFLAEVRTRGAHLAGLLTELRERNPERIRAVRGRGLIFGIELDAEDAADVVDRARDEGLLLVPAGPRVVRILPPLTASTEELSRAVHILGRCLDPEPAPRTNDGKEARG